MLLRFEFMQFIEHIYELKGIRVNMNDRVLNFLLTCGTGERNAFRYLYLNKVFDSPSALKIKEIAKGLKLHPSNASRNLKTLFAAGVVSRNYNLDGFVEYFIPKEALFPIGKTAVPESLKVTLDPIPFEDNNEKVVKATTTVEKPVIKEKPKKVRLEHQAKELFDYYIELFEKSSSYKLTPKRKSTIMARLKEGFSVEDCKRHIDCIFNSPFHNGENEQNKKYNDIKDIIFNEDKFHKRINDLEDAEKEHQKKINKDKVMTMEEIDAKLAKMKEEESKPEKKEEVNSEFNGLF